jgi:RNA polymerase sigma-70 factor, ECF subfamily
VDYSALSSEELVNACVRSGEELAWVEFVRRFQPLIASLALRVARQWGETAPQVIDDLVQDVYLKLCAKDFRLLRKFTSAHEGAIYGYIKVFTANLARDHFKASHAQKRGGSVETASLDDGAPAQRVKQLEPEVAILERKLLLGRVATCLNVVASGSNAERDRRIFWLYYRVGLSSTAIAALPAIGLSTKGVESTILRLTRAVRRQLAPQKQQGKSPGEAVEGIRPAESF